jgi:hypothetical protein
MVLLLAAFVVASPEAPIHNRVWHLLSRAPSPLASIDFTALEMRGRPSADRTKNVASRGLAYSLNTFDPSVFPYQERYIAEPILATLAPILSKLNGTHQTAPQKETGWHVFVTEQMLYPTQYSIAGAAIRHWNAQQLSIDLGGQPELAKATEATLIPLIRIPPTESTGR